MALSISQIVRVLSSEATAAGFRTSLIAHKHAENVVIEDPAFMNEASSTSDFYHIFQAAFVDLPLHVGPSVLPHCEL